MQGSRNSTQTFLIDANVFISAIIHPERETDTFRLLIKFVKDSNTNLVGNVLLAEEFRRYAELFESEKATILLSAFLSKMKLVEVPENYVKICKEYIETPDKADILHAATCIETNSILVTNDQHFDRIREEGIIKVLSTSEAIGKYLP